VGVIRDADTDVERVVTLVFEIPPLEEVGRGAAPAVTPIERRP
jgi:hypothetical protein